MAKGSSASILLLEDDRLFSETLADFLEESGYEVECAFDPLRAFDLSFDRRFDLYLFDINLPFQNGFDVMRQLRESGDRTPVIFLTSREDKGSLLEGFDLGADDYLRKPVDLDELDARVRAVLRRGRQQEETVAIGPYLMDSRSRDLLGPDGKPLKLGRKIYDLLALLLREAGEVVTMEAIRQHLWRHGEEPSDGAIRVYITRLKKLFPHAVENVRGVGYRFQRDAVDGPGE
ncbi:response regulator transcription factor [Nitratifractor sp.]